MSRNYRIKDIAALSGVSTGTVDRILHNRGKVSEEARKKVEKVLKEIDYHPNLIARSLALKKKYHFYTLIPSFSEGEYWATFSQGIAKAEEELFSYNVDVTPLYFNQYDKSSFDRLIEKLENADCQGVVIATLFKESVLKLTSRLDKKEIPYVLIDAYIEQTNCIAYYGTNSYDSGYIAGRLIWEQIEKEEDIAIFRFLRKGDLFSTQVQVRESGFRDYLNEKGYMGRIHPVRIHADDQSENDNVLDSFFQEHPQVQAGIIFNSRAHLLGNYFTRQSANQPFKLIGYDVIDANINYLNNGYITHLIAQRPEVQGVNCVKALFRHLTLNEKVNLINYMPIDILMKENIQYYNNYI
ncbi:LacI family transcriptional regulator [Parabacteroides sp. 52]|uniref:LacI family DNA-binding transcriptional regulator n=1 Tax=unclassified Parabacteroides TaxID=2649774 RepID=UPI0013D3E734|nr:MULTISPECIES: LacI family DNA-binding transcriptional regulator [unclassified Parabacteroides]MDH6535666.1 LacI family transcriptional regulator [Parabacteroides sp. PM5-20]NDV56272.1 LacI family transcriptional regulator [Parabacteroides sp. 52]